MKRIVFIGSGLSSGGAEHQCAQLMNMLTERGYDVTYASFGDVEDHYYVSPKVRRIQLAQEKSTAKKVIAVEWYLIRVRADVVFAFSQRLSCLTLFPLLLRPRVKVISGERNFTVSAPDKFEKILIKTGIYRRANYVVPNNYSQGQYLSKIMPAISRKIHVITNYTDIDLYKNSLLPNNSLPRIGIFCRFEEQKNFLRLLDALNVLNQRYDYKYHIDWYGNHSFKTESQIKYFKEGLLKIKKFQLEECLTIHEPTKDVSKLIPTFDVMCLPSLHEGFSNSISEYICCGRPVICSDVSDNHVMVHEGENGFLFNPLDVEDIVRAFEKFFSASKEKRIAMGMKSREIAESLFSKERFISDYIKLIEA